MCYIQLRTSALERFLKACPSQGRVFSIRGAAVRRKDGPVAQLGARFHGMEEVDSSNPSRSTKLNPTHSQTTIGVRQFWQLSQAADADLIVPVDGSA